ncbi:MAG TPA: thioesterase domain-containing protein [Gemmatimonadales bacterium]|nr:thioesterase domain-containing protein [Gemmatimonadales bacterium]
MTVATLLAELRSRDIRVWPDGDQLRCNAPAGVLTPELRNELQQHKRDIVEFLRSAETLARQERAIVPLQPRGDLIPVFAVPGHNGNVLSFRTLAQHLGEDQPFYGLQPPGVEGEAVPLTSVEGLAAYFASRILTFRPKGPYLIAGHCSGGMIAFELARQLEQRGASIPLVALFASPYPSSWRAVGQLRQRLEEYVKRVRRHARALASLSYRERCRYLSAFLQRLVKAQPETSDVPPPGAAPDQAAVLRAELQNATMMGVRRYTPRYFAGRLSLFLPNQDWRHSGHGALRWRSVARETEVSCGPDGCEGDRILLEPYAAGTAELFRRCRDRVVPKPERH